MEALKEGLLKTDPGLLIWTVITFLIFLLILWKAAWKPIVDALDTRAEKVRGDLDNAEKSRIESEELLNRHKEMMDKANEEAQKIIAESKSQAEKMKDDIVDKARVEAKEVITKAKREIDIAKAEALRDIKEEVVTISTDIASNIIARNLNPEDQRGIVEEALTNLNKVN
ncbi:MAG: F0F1 ATP synthase subunit B [Spirochaetota bacterium]|nr:F0F1 ATP synthase subunit B [Spirochaetota bacterium]